MDEFFLSYSIQNKLQLNLSVLNKSINFGMNNKSRKLLVANMM